jgi:ABC-type xylose transport system substrate-binding protein
MQTDLQIVPTQGLSEKAAPPTYVNHAEHGVQVHNAGQLQINNNMILLAGGDNNSNLAANAIIAALQAYMTNKSNEYYSLFVTNYDGWENGQFFVMPERALTDESYILPEIKKRLASLDSAAKAEIKTFPSLFMAENVILSGREIDPNQVAYYGFVTEIAVQRMGVKIAFQKLSQLSQQGVNRIWRELDIQCPNGYGELTHSHWSVKNVNLLDELKRAGLISAQL